MNIRSALLLLPFLVLLFPAAATAQALPRLQVEGNQLVASDNPITLRGVSLCSLSWHDPLKLLQGLARQNSGWNVNVVRLPVQPVEWKRLGPENYFRERLDPAVEECRKNGLYCIIDWHEIGDWDKKETEQDLLGFWRRAASRYAHEPFILYEIFNEPTEPKSRDRENWLAWRAKAQGWVDMVRARAPETVLLVGSPHWSQMPSFAVEDPFRGKNLVYVMHLYGGWPRESWDDLFGDAAATLPLFVTEWGWSALPRNRETPFYGTRAAYAGPLRAYFDARPQVSWTAWSYDPHCGPAMTGDDADMGEFVREWLAQSAPKNPPP